MIVESPDKTPPSIDSAPTDIEKKPNATSSSTTAREPQAAEIKGNMYTLMSIQLYSTNLQQIQRSLAKRVQQAPAFFCNTPVIIDFSRVEVDEYFDFKALFKVTRIQNLMPVAVRGIANNLSGKLKLAGVPIVEPGGSQAEDSTTKPNNTTEMPSQSKQRPRTGQSLIVEKSISAGQQVYAKNADLILLAATQQGAELVADGNIHSYGILRGKVLCGVTGDTQARIFCRSLEARLISVAGRYKILKEIPAGIKNKPVQIRLKGEQLLVEPLE